MGEDALERFFPPCIRPECPRAGTEHADVLPHQRELITSSERFVALVGGYGAAKTVGACVLGVALSLQIPGNVGVVCRHSYTKLHDSTERPFLEILQRLGVEFKSREMRDGWPHRIILPNESEVHFRETKDPGRWLGQEYGWFFIDEAKELPKKTFVDIVSRLRLPQAAKYRKGFITSNPPDHQHWIAEVFGLTPGATERREEGIVTKYRLIRVSTRANPFLPREYVADLKANNPASEVKRIIEGEYGFSYEGKAVYSPPFSFDQHVAELAPVPGYTVVRAWDFGYHAPAVTWHQFPRCKEGTTHWRTLHEYPGKDLEAEDLARVVKDQTYSLVPDLTSEQIFDCGDAAGAQISDKGPGPIIRLAKAPWRLHFKYRHLPNIDPGLALVRDAMRAAGCKCGLPVYQVARSCRHTIDAFAGGYHYPMLKPGMSELRMKPFKDGFYDNLADSVRYVAECWYRRLLTNPEVIDQLMTDNLPRVAPLEAPARWAWMGA